MRANHPLFLFFMLISAGLCAEETLRGEVSVPMEPLYGGFVDIPAPQDTDALRRRALEEGVLFFSGMIYGWSFHYDIGEKARGIPEAFEMTPLGTIPFGDSCLKVTDVKVEDARFRVWMDYSPGESQRRRLDMWKAGAARSAQALGYGPLVPPSGEDWTAGKRAALEDAARAALRAALRGGERNRPKEARGFIALAAFPRCSIDSGRWAVSARFRLDIRDIAPFAAY